MNTLRTLLRFAQPSLAVLAVLALSLYGADVHAKENGKAGRTALSSAGCGSCHSSGASSSVTMTASSSASPFTVAPGGTIQIEVAVSHATASVAGIDIDVATAPDGIAAGTLSAPAGSGLKLSGSELVHSTPKPFVNGQATFTILWTAPSTPGTYTLRAVALAANGNGADDASDVWNRLPETSIVVEGTPPPAQSPVTVTSPNGGERYHVGESIAILWDAALPLANIRNQSRKIMDRLQSDDDESDDDESDDDESDDDESDDDESDEDDSDDDDSDDDDSDDDDSDDDDSDDDDSDDDDSDDDDSDDDDSDDDDSDDDDSDDDDSDDDESDDDDSDDDDSDDDDSTSAGSSLYVRIEWSAESNNGPWMTVADSVSAASKQFDWIAPNQLTETAWIRITRLDSAGAFDINDLAFAIVDSTGTDSAGIVVAQPATGETLATGSLYTVRWSGDAHGMVTLTWNQCGAGWVSIAENIPASLGEYTWSVPTDVAGVATLRVVDAQTQLVLAEVRNIVMKPIVSSVEEESGSTVSVYPHPVSLAQDAVLELPSVPGTVEVLDLGGRTLLQLPASGRVLLPTRTLQPGAYVIRWVGVQGSTATRLVSVIQ